MKKDSIRTLLGLKQEDIAMLLGVTRSQWAMYETGKRDLPVSAMQLLAEMLTHVQAQHASARQTHNEKQDAKHHEQLEHLLRENKYHLLRLVKEMAATEKKIEAQLRLPLVADFLNNRKVNGKSENNHHQHILHKVQIPTADLDAILMQQQLKKEVLEFEQTLLESKLKN